MIPIYFAGQLLGVIIALVVARYVNNLNQAGELVMIKPVMPDTTDAVGILREIANEMMGTILMVFFILQITNPNTTFIENEISGFLSIAFFFYLSIVLCPKTNSFVINFAITIGVNLFCTVYDGNVDGWQWIWVYLLGDVLGVLIATLFYDRFFEPIIKRLR
jgi:glycerol uptake facilitator-like aquaporin